MISKRLVKLIYSHILDPWQCPISEKAEDMVHELDNAIGNDGYVDGIYYLKAEHKLWDTGRLFPVFCTEIALEVHGESLAIRLGIVISIEVKNGWAKLMVSNNGSVHFVMLPTDCEDMRMSDKLITRRGYNW